MLIYGNENFQILDMHNVNQAIDSQSSSKYIRIQCTILPAEPGGPLQTSPVFCANCQHRPRGGFTTTGRFTYTSGEDGGTNYLATDASFTAQLHCTKICGHFQSR